MRVYVNLDRRPDRRSKCEGQFKAQGIEVARFPAVDQKRVKRTRGHGSAAEYACQLSHRLILRKAAKEKVSSVLILEDDVILQKNFKSALERLDPPDDWGIILFGCTYVNMPKVMRRGWVRVHHFWGTHAYAVRDNWIQPLLEQLNAPVRRHVKPGIDNVISCLSYKIPIYAVYPNLAWQGASFSDVSHQDRQEYGETGGQLRRENIIGRIDEMMNCNRGIIGND